MKISEIKSIVEDVPYCSGKDCSEYAEDIVWLIPDAEIVTILPIDRNNMVMYDSIVVPDGNTEGYLYHTVAMCTTDGIDYVLDVTAAKEFKCSSLRKYIRYFLERNTCDIAVIHGLYDDIFQRNKNINGYPVHSIHRNSRVKNSNIFK